MISSVRNPTVRKVRRLRKPLFRERERAFLVEGARAVEAALRSGRQVRALFHLPEAAARREALLKEAAASRALVHEVSREVMAWLSGATAPPEVLAVAELREAPLEAVGAGPGALLAGLRDPRTVGAVMAAVAAAGGRFVVAAAGTADVFRDKAVRAARGAHFFLDIVRGVAAGEAAARVRAAGGRLIGLEAEGAAPWEADLARPFALVLAGEGRPLDAGIADVRVAVRGPGGPAPLAAAAAVVLFEAERQRLAARDNGP